MWSLAGSGAPTAGISRRNPLIIDIDAALVNVHSSKERAAGTFKGGFGFRPLTAWIDHGAVGGNGENAVIMLRAGNAGSSTVADHVEVIRAALDQVGLGRRPGRKVLVRIDGAGGTKETIRELTRRRVAYSVGFTLPDMTDIYPAIPEEGWAPAYDTGGDARQDADVADITGMLDLSGWPAGMRAIVRREKPSAGTRPRAGDPDGYRLTAFATNTPTGQVPDLEVRHRLRARCEDRIRCAKDTGPGAMPLNGYNRNRLWCLVTALARTHPRLVPDARPGRAPGTQVGTQDHPPAPAQRPGRHRRPRPNHHPAPQSRSPLGAPAQPGKHHHPLPGCSLTP